MTSTRPVLQQARPLPVCDTLSLKNKPKRAKQIRDVRVLAANSRHPRSCCVRRAQRREQQGECALGRNGFQIRLHLGDVLEGRSAVRSTTVTAERGCTCVPVFFDRIKIRGSTDLVACACHSAKRIKRNGAKIRAREMERLPY